MTTALIIVESPAKARTISRYLGPDFEVESSIGHVRDLPSSAAEIPKKVKNEPWARLGVNIEADFEPVYVVPPSKSSQIKKLRAKLKDADALYLATDEDREGEAIAWHLVEVLKPDVPVRRMVFHEITRSAIERALEATRDIDDRLVDAQETRRILDRLVGYEVSPLLWKKLKSGLSAGRVQSVATRLVVVREEARMRFTEAAYCGLEARCSTSDGGFAARLAELDGQRVATGKDFDADSGEVEGSGVLVLTDDRATALAERLEGRPLEVAEVADKPFTSRPYPPFMTSTLQQEAGRKLRFNAQRTMRIAQSLYENGFITYMRTDSTALSSEAVSAARRQVRELYGDRYLPDKPRAYQSRSKSAQEAHEAIRPAGERFRKPDDLRRELDRDQFRLYELIWKRTLASQMPDAKGRRTTVRLHGDGGDERPAVFTASGKVIEFPGFLRAYVEGSDDPEGELADQEKVLPPLQEGQDVAADELEVTHHTTQPPARYTEASLVKELETLGIGRPSTYAAIIQTIQDRGYVWHKGPALVPTFTAFAVVKLLEQNLPDLVDYDFTARMEDELDTIARGEREAVPWLKDFYFGGDRTNGGRKIVSMGLKKLIDSTVEGLAAREASQIRIGTTDDGAEVAVRIGRYGAFVQIGDTERRASVPEDLPPDELTVEEAVALVERAEAGDRPLGHDPDSGKPVYVKSGRFGPYVQLGDPEPGKKGGKPKMASLWPSMSPDSVTLDEALMLLKEFPREVGRHPESGDVITAQDGKYGPYLKMGDETRSLENHRQLLDVTEEQALELFRQPKKGRRRQQSATLDELGVRPGTDDAVSVKTGRFGPYVTDGTVNASVPKGRDPSTLTLADAVELLERREQKLRDQGKDPRAKPVRRRAAKKKTGGRKGGAKKKSTKK